MTNNGDGTYTTRTTNQGNTTHTTTCTGPNSCNTTTTTNNPDGTTATQQQQGDMADICQRNPSIQLCKQGKESSFGGACNGSGFAGQCDGDAIQCAMARKQHELACMLTATSPESQLYDAEKGKTGNQTADNPNNSSFGLSSSSFDTSSAFGGSGSCLADKSIPMWGGHSFDLPLSTLCPHLETFGNLLVAIAFLLAIRIVRT